MSLGSLGSLVIGLGADTAGFETDLGRAQRLTEKHAKMMQRSFERAAQNIFLAFESYKIGEKIVDSVLESAKRADELGKAAQKIGINTQRLSELKYAASLADVQFDSLTSGIAKFNKATVEANQGSAAQVSAFKAVGVSFEDLRDKSPDQLLAEVAERFSQAADTADKTALAMALFGKSGADLIPLLNAGATGLAEAADEAHKLGVAIGEDASRAAEKFNDNLHRLQAAAEGVANRVSAALLPTMVQLSDDLVSYAKDAENSREYTERFAAAIKVLSISALAVKAAFNGIGKAIGTELAFVSQIFKDLEASDYLIPGKLLYKLGKNISEQTAPLTQSVTEIADDFERDFGRIQKILDAPLSVPMLPSVTGEKPVKKNRLRFGGDESADLAKMSDAQKLIENLQKQIALYGNLSESEKVRISIANDYYGAVTSAQKKRLQALAQELDAMGALRDKEKEAKDVYESILTPVEKLREEIVKLNDLRNSVGKNGSPLLDDAAYQRAVENAQNSFDELAKKADEANNQMAEFAKQAAHNIQNSFAQFLFNPFEKGVDGMLKSFVEFLAQAAAQAAAASILKEVFGGLASSDNGFLSALGAAFGGGKAVGGSVSSDKTYLVGERGPELFRPNNSGNIIPNHRLSSMIGGGGGTSVQVNVNVESGKTDIGANSGQNARALGERLSAVVREELVNQKRPGGLLAA